MFSYVSLGTRDITRSVAFYRRGPGTLGTFRIKGCDRRTVPARPGAWTIPAHICG